MFFFSKSISQYCYHCYIVESYSFDFFMHVFCCLFCLSFITALLIKFHSTFTNLKTFYYSLFLSSQLYCYRSIIYNDINVPSFCFQLRTFANLLSLEIHCLIVPRTQQYYYNYHYYYMLLVFV